MAAAALQYGDDGCVAWDVMWTDFCDLALAGGPPHRDGLLEPADPVEVRSRPEEYATVVTEMARGIELVSGLPVVRDGPPGWIGVACADEAMAVWLLRAIVAENVCVRRNGSVLYLPAGPSFRLDYEIRNVITALAKTAHYWREHVGQNKLTVS
jgi:sirohydrochlorin cobaltochelatase